MSEETNAKLASQKQELNRTLLTMFDYLGLKGDLRIEEKNGKLQVKITSDDAGRIIGRKGQILESLQLLANRILFKQDDEFPHVMLSIDGYGERRKRRSDDEGAAENGEESAPRSERRRSPRTGASRISNEQLEQQAKDAAKEVKRWGEPVKLPEMNAHDRRIIHVTLQDDPEVTTESEGEGAMKKVVISLKKAE
ncbi:MAG: KH domain-containing protein [Lentisphaeria bacterium]|nr:KH domain-containing protein [Lentisphaeria bacterium]